MYVCNNGNKILNDVPMFINKVGKMVPDFKNMIGFTLILEYENKVYNDVKIIDYIGGSRSKIVTQYNDYIKSDGVYCNNFLKGFFGTILKEVTKEFKIEIGESFKDEKRDLVITDREYRIDKKGQNQKYYRYTCNKCGWTEGWILESALIKGVNCACCTNQVVVKGINDITTTAPWMMKWISEEDAKKYTKGSGKKVEIICPDCGKKRFITPHQIHSRKSISCTCGDGISYPEKFMTNTLIQLELEFQTQLSKTTFEWCNKYKYDFYIPKYNMIIETHGVQHYEESPRGKTLEEEQENDRIKKELAKENDIDHYIVIDCRHSDLEWIKDSILNSELSKLFNLSSIDWNKCEEFALSNLAKNICDYWNQKEEWETTKDIGLIFNLNRYAATKYLKKRSKIRVV